MKKDFFEELKERLMKKHDNNVSTSEKFTGYNAGQLDKRDREPINYNQLENGYIRMIGNGAELVTKEQIVNEVINEIKNFIRLNEKVISLCRITDDEWRIFLEVAYNYFTEYQLAGGFSRLVMTGIQYVMFNGFVNSQKEVTLQTLLENFEIPMLPWGVANGMIEAIRRDCYMTTRKDNVVNLQEYRKVSKK